MNLVIDDLLYDAKARMQYFSKRIAGQVLATL